LAVLSDKAKEEIFVLTTDEFRKMALALPEAMEQPHFERTSFRVNKKIFATMAEKEGIGVVMLTPVDQSVFCDVDAAFYPVNGGWGAKGATEINLKKAGKAAVKDALKCAYMKVAPKRLLEELK
jgi:hypothetical protein